MPSNQIKITVKMYLTICVYVHAQASTTHVEVRRQLSGISSLLPPPGIREGNSDPRVCTQAPPPTDHLARPNNELLNASVTDDLSTQTKIVSLG